MSSKAAAWMLLAAIALAAVLLFNYWASYQPLSTLAYAGFVVAIAGLANLIYPFRFLGVHQRAAGALVLAAGVVLMFAALFWPAAIIRVARPRGRLDELMPEYQFSERHSARVHARPEQVILATRQSTFADLKSLLTLLKIRGVVLRTPFHDMGDLQTQRILDKFAEAGYLFDGSEQEIAMFGVWNVRANRRPEVHTLQEYADYRDPGAVKMAFDFTVEDMGDGWSTLRAETRVAATDASTLRGVGRYWRLIVPGSGLLRRQWLKAIKKRAESLPNLQSSIGIDVQQQSYGLRNWGITDLACSRVSASPPLPETGFGRVPSEGRSNG